MVLQAIAVSSVKHSCESMLESLVSKFENHFDSRRNYDVTQFVCQLFQRCYKGYPRLFSGCFLEFLWCFICVSRVFQRHYKASLINFYPANIRNLAESF